MATLTTFYNECLIEMDVTVKTKTFEIIWDEVKAIWWVSQTKNVSEWEWL